MENNEEIKNYVPNQIVSKEDLKTYFENGDVPDEQDFWEWQDSYWHKNDPQDIIPADRVDLSGKADKNATNLDGENVQNWRTKLNIQDPTQIIPVSNTESGIVNNTSLQELGGVDKLINKVRIGKGSGNTAAIIEDSTALGDSALSSNTTGKNNTAIGANVLKVNTTGGFNTGIGDYALWSNTTGIWNTAIGSAALVYNTTGQYNSAVGAALYFNSTGSRNIGFGTNAGRCNTTGTDNTYVGYLAAFDNSLGSYNVAIGRGVMSITTSGYTNGGSVENLNRNVFIGSKIQSSAGMNDTLAIDNKGATVTAAANALIYGGFSPANRFLNVGGKLSVTSSYMPNAQGDAAYTKNIVAKTDGTFGWEDKGISTAFTSPVTLGGIASGTNFPKGTELLTFMQKLLNAIQYPSRTNYSQTFTNNRGIANSGIYEIGTTFTDVTFSKTYLQGIIRGKTVNGIWEQNTEQGKNSGELTKFVINGIDIGVNPSINLGNIVVTYGTNTITSSVSFASGDQPFDSMGNNYQSPTVAGNNIRSDINFTGVFKAFYGNKETPTFATGSDVRLLQNANMISSLKKVILATGNTNVNYHVFLPSSFVVTKVLDLSSNNQDITDKYQLLGTFEVPDAAGTPRTYMHYRMINTAPYSTSHNHEINFN